MRQKNSIHMHPRIYIVCTCIHTHTFTCACAIYLDICGIENENETVFGVSGSCEAYPRMYVCMYLGMYVYFFMYVCMYVCVQGGLTWMPDVCLVGYQIKLCICMYVCMIRISEKRIHICMICKCMYVCVYDENNHV